MEIDPSIRPPTEASEASKEVLEDKWFGAVQEYANTGVYACEKYGELVERYGAENDIFAQLYLEKGVANAIMRIRTLRKLEDKTVRAEGLTLKESALKHMENGGVPAAWMTQLLMWNQEEDPGGLQVLRELISCDKKQVMRGDSHFDAVEEEDRRHYAEAMAATEDLIITFYERQRFPERFLPDSNLIFQS